MRFILCLLISPLTALFPVITAYPGRFLSRTSHEETYQDFDPPAIFPKYFQEPDAEGLEHHYDIRFFTKVLGNVDRQDTLLHLLQSYIEFFQQTSMETWLAHGTLLGWWWNGKMLPWDGDIDMQTSIQTLLHMAKFHNATTYQYQSTIRQGVGTSAFSKTSIDRQYLLDVNPAATERRRDNGENIIDARWIDVRNGLYIDITAVAETHPIDASGMWACKNYHRYHLNDLWPMRESIFEGKAVKVPYAYEKILAEEYGDKALVVGDFHGHRWNSIDQVWCKKTAAEEDAEESDPDTPARREQEEEARQMQAIRELENYHLEERPVTRLRHKQQEVYS